MAQKNPSDGWEDMPAAEDGWEDVPAEAPDTHGLPAKIAHYGAMALPAVGGVTGGILSGVAGLPTGPGDLLIAAGGAALGAGSGRAMQKAIDMKLGYDRPDEPLTHALADVAETGLRDAAYTTGAGVATAGLAKGAAMLPGAMDALAVKLGRRVLSGGTTPLNVKKALTPEVIDEAYKQGAFKPFGTTQAANATLQSAREESGQLYNELLAKMEAKGITGPNAKQFARELSQEAQTTFQNSLHSPKPAMFQDAAEELAAKRSALPGNTLSLTQAESMKRTLQAEAKKEYDKLTQQLSPIGETKMDLASRLRKAIEDRVQMQAKKAPAEAAQFVPAKQQFGRIAQASDLAERGAAQADRRSPFSLFDILLAGAGHTHGGMLEGAGMAAGSKALRTFGPSTATWALKGGADLLERAPSMSPQLSRAAIALAPAEAERVQLEALIQALRQKPVGASYAGMEEQ